MMKPRDAHVCYRYLIVRLSVNDQHQRLIEVCRKIRAHGRAAGRVAFHQEIEQTYIFELEALCPIGSLSRRVAPNARLAATSASK